MTSDVESRITRMTLNALSAALLLALMLSLLAGSTLPLSAQQPGTASPSGAYSVVPQGTRFLVKLDDSLSSKKHKAGKKFDLKLLDPLETPDGFVILPGTKIRGHVSRVEPASLTGRARLWLSFDEIKSKRGKLPVVANVVSVPGEHSVKPGPSKEGEIESRTSRGAQEVQAAAIGAGIGAAVGAAAKGGKGAAIGAAVGGLSGFLIASGMGQELELQKGTKLELELERPIYIDKR